MRLGHWLRSILALALVWGSSFGSIQSSWSDPIGDEQGIYPLSSDFSETGQFDLTQFQIDASLTEFNISITFQNLTNPANAPNGFSHPITQIYFHTSPRGSYRVEKLGFSDPIGNSNILLDSQYQWRLMIEITGWNVEFYSDQQGIGAFYPYQIQLIENTIHLQILDHSLGEPSTNWAYTVLVGAYNYQHPTMGKFRKINRDPSYLEFGGGDDGDYDPNILDILTLPNAAWSQNHILASYCTQNKLKATISPVSEAHPDYARASNPPSSVWEPGGINCIDSNYQTQPRERYAIVSRKQINSRLEYYLSYVEALENLEEFGHDRSQLLLFIEQISANIFRFTIQDTSQTRWQVPKNDWPEPPNFAGGEYLYDWALNYTPFGIRVVRKANQDVIFNSAPNLDSSQLGFRNLVFKQNYLEFSTSISSDSMIFGLGERVDSLNLERNQIYTIWNMDQGTPRDKNLYGHHPFFIELREEFAHGVFLANNLGMDVVLGTDRITYKVMGGILDFYVFLGPSVEEVVQQYQSIIGKPKPPPFWGVGYHQCRWGYKTLAELEQVYSEFQSHHLPLDTLWSDIDYMDRWKIWTLDQVNYPQNDLKNFVDSLHQANLHYVMIVDPGIKIQPGYWVYDQALRQNLFISNSEGTQPQIGKVWPGAVHFLDFTQVSTMNFWKDVISTFHDSVGFDGLWLDMNELANFCDGHCKLDISNWNQTGESEYQFNCVCSEYEFHSEDFPPFWPGGVPPGFSTLTLSSKHFNSSEFEVHSLYGLLEAKATHLALEQVRKERSFIISRSTFAGSGSWTGHWLGDNSATWQDLQDSISGIINMNLFGIPFVGADICGFNGNTTAELCGRWYQLGALYPFSRNHNGFGYMSQEPYTFGDAITSVVRSSLELRYSLLSFYYSHLFEISLFGGTFIDALAFEFPGDSVARTIETQFLIGKALMFAPVCESGQIEKQVYFPEGALWYNYFTGKALPHENRTGIWKDFSSLHFEEIFLFLRGGSVVFTQAPALNSEETRKNPISIIVGLDPLRNASANFFVDDGISKFDSAYSRYSAWNVFATSGSQGIGQIDVMITQQNYTLEGLEWNNITLYGVAPPCTLVLLNYTEELEFVYDHHTQVLVIVLNRSVYDSFSVYWGEGEPTQSILERIIILVGSLTLTLSLLSCVSVLMYYYGKAHRRPPTFCCKRQRREISFDSLANETLLLDGPKDIPMTEM